MAAAVAAAVGTIGGAAAVAAAAVAAFGPCGVEEEEVVGPLSGCTASCAVVGGGGPLKCGAVGGGGPSCSCPSPGSPGCPFILS